jgi:hypothetical protein
MRRWPVRLLVVLLYLANVFVLVWSVLVLVPVPGFHVDARTQVDALLPGGAHRRVTVSVPVGATSDRMLLWAGYIPAVIVVLMVSTLLIRICKAVLAGDPFQPRVLGALRSLAAVLAVGGTVASLIAEQVEGAVGRRITLSGSYSVTLPFQWIFCGLLASLAALIVAEGVRRNAPAAAYQQYQPR